MVFLIIFFVWLIRYFSYFLGFGFEVGVLMVVLVFGKVFWVFERRGRFFICLESGLVSVFEVEGFADRLDFFW